jgi:hemoglobin-like flavoprotein
LTRAIEAPLNACGMACSNPIEQSFELAAERCADMTPLVYQRLFAAHPEARALFRTEGSEPVQGSMLMLTIEAILDYAGERSGRYRMIECEAVSHDAYGTSRDLFVTFFTAIADTLRDLLGPKWSDEIDGAWRTLLAELDTLVEQRC